METVGVNCRRIVMSMRLDTSNLFKRLKNRMTALEDVTMNSLLGAQ